MDGWTDGWMDGLIVRMHKGRTCRRSISTDGGSNRPVQNAVAMSKNRVRECPCEDVNCRVNHVGRCRKVLERNKHYCFPCLASHEIDTKAREAMQKKVKRQNDARVLKAAATAAEGAYVPEAVAVDQTRLHVAESALQSEKLARQAAEEKVALETEQRVTAQASERKQHEVAMAAEKEAAAIRVAAEERLRQAAERTLAEQQAALADARQKRLLAEEQAADEGKRRKVAEDKEQQQRQAAAKEVALRQKSEQQLAEEKRGRQQADARAASAEERQQQMAEQTKRLTNSLTGLRCPSFAKASIFGRGGTPVKHLGKGGFGSVAQHRFVGGGYVAVKSIVPRRQKDEASQVSQWEQDVSALRNEVKILHYLAAIANIINTYGMLSTSDKEASYAIEFASHGCLYSFVKYALPADSLVDARLSAVLCDAAGAQAC